ncbi:Calx-beta domain-containing protein [Nitrosomonas sp.]|uniref:Calx-beta domain-containing protein n=1 Tax=Nitrosomonas sp. TaxID=42353 RepID=UPI002613640A|nr:Calx-beta domain-containing protein [Nitrosomonas sp.]
MVSINDFAVDEASKEAAFVITLDRPSTSAVTMNYATQNGTAIAGADFVAKTGSLSFAPGETAKTVKVTITNDAAFENAEAFNLALSALTNATTLDGVGTVLFLKTMRHPWVIPGFPSTMWWSMNRKLTPIFWCAWMRPIPLR